MMLGSQCSPCCAECPVDGKPRTDPRNEGNWIPNGSWPDVTFVFQPNPGDSSGRTWFFYGSQSTSKKGGGATIYEQQDWNNPCNWYSSLETPFGVFTSSFGFQSFFASQFNKRATGFPPPDAVAFFFTKVSTASVGPQSLKAAYFVKHRAAAVINPAGLAYGSVLNVLEGEVDSRLGAAFFNKTGVGFTDATSAANEGTVNGGAFFSGLSRNLGTVSEDAVFYGRVFENRYASGNLGIVNGFASFVEGASNHETGFVNGGATFSAGGASLGSFNYGTVSGGAVFNDQSANSANGIANDGATFNDTSVNVGLVTGGATFNDFSKNQQAAPFGTGLVNGGAVFNDSACSEVVFANRFTAHPTDAPTCNGSALPYGGGNNCGCG